MKRRIAGAALALLVSAAAAVAELPVRSESVIWTSLAWNGRDYSATFAPETSASIYLLAGVDNFLSLRKTLIYWWPITAEWRTDTDSLNVQFPGTMELAGGRQRPQDMPMVDYTYFNVRGDYELNWKVLTGDAARAEVRKYTALYDSYFKEVRDYQSKTAAYESEMSSLGTEIQKRKDQHRDYSALLRRLNTLPQPVPPARPGYYVVPPADLRQGFVVNLPPGQYAIRLVNPEGQIIEGSEKTVVVHAPRRTGGIGFEVIPSDKWTRPEESQTPSSVLYLNGKADLFLRPYFEDEYNDLGYEKTLNNGARGNPSVYKWVRVQQVPHATIDVSVPGAPMTALAEQAFSVQQSEGNSLGYIIRPFDPSGPSGGSPDLVAFQVRIEPGTRSIALLARDSGGHALPGSAREIRIVGPYPAVWALLALALSPLLAMIIRLVLRARSYSTERISDT
jgi:hypothetical protein